MPSALPKPVLYCKPGGVLSLSGPGLQEFLRELLAKGASCRFTARGFSMHPFIQDGDVITVSPLSRPAPGAGDVVAFCHPETRKLLIHRVLSRPHGGYLMRGDSAPGADGIIALEYVLGAVGRVERQGRQVRLGLGPERRFIAWLSRHNLLQPLIRRTWQVLRPALNRFPR